MSTREHVPPLLNVPTMPLTGRHLIEASAGTGKTYNITRLYLRLLLEKKLTVKEILVMTFTKAATEEIKGRIAKTLREASSLWDAAIAQGNGLASDTDPVYVHLYNTCSPKESVALLKAAQLELDEASVFTIHGFCQHVISQLAFNSGFAMTLNLSKDTSELYLQAAEDWIRKISHNDDDFLLLAQHGWHVPDNLLSEFSSSIKSTLAPVLLDKEAIEDAFIASLQHHEDTAPIQFSSHLNNIIANETLIHQELIKKPEHITPRTTELEALKAWLAAACYTPLPAEGAAFLDGRRFGRNKSGVKEILAPIKVLADAILAAFVEKQESVEKIPVFTLVNDAIGFIKQHVAAQKKQLGVIDFDDLIRMLADEVGKPNNGLVPELRKKFPVALIDEFQDTDADQYAILDGVYPKASDQNALLMIGDPKQAIYRFRGGDIFTYLKAGEQADYRWVMNTNWRSVEGMVKAYNRLFYGAPLSEITRDVFGFNIQYNPVEFAPNAEAAKHPLNDPCESRSAMNYVSVKLQEKSDGNTLRRGVGAWIAQEIYRLFNEVTFSENPPRPVKPADIAILVKNRTEASAIKYVLQQQGLACVYLSDRSNLFAMPEAKDILRLLNGIWHCSDNSKVASSLASPLWGYAPQTLVSLLYHEDDELWDDAYQQVTSLRDMWLQKGCMSVLLYLMQEKYTPIGSDIERALTNYQHLAETLEKADAAHQRPEQLLGWLHQQIHQPESNEEMTLRLESDSQLIRLVTQHGSKGLEYPIVFIPFATGYRDPAKNGKSYSQIFTYYDEKKQDLQLQLGRSKNAIQRVRKEGDAEEMRLTYVAVTRAAHRCYMGVVLTEGHEKSALARAFDLNEKDGRDWQTVLDEIANEPDAYASHISADTPDNNDTEYDASEVQQTLSVLQFAGTSSEDWRLYSFSALSRMATQSPRLDSRSTMDLSPPSIPVLQTLRDEEITSTEDYRAVFSDSGFKDINGIESNSANQPNLSDIRFTLQKGASAGNLLHDLLELNDFSAPSWQQSGAEMAARFGLEDSEETRLYDWLNEVLYTPLGSSSGVALADLPQHQTLREAEFYFPMNHSNWNALREVLSTHRKKVALALQTCANEGEALSMLEPVPKLVVPALAGMMHGFIDLIFEHNGKYYVADYKSTWLGDDVADYLPVALYRNNQHHLYDLQYLIYSLALHRYLTNALPHYLPDSHFGGVYYLYLRGMHPSNTNGEGVFFTPIDTETLDALDEIFAGEGNAKNSSVTEVAASNTEVGG